MYLSPSPSLSIISDNDGSYTPNKIIHEINHDEFAAMVKRYYQTPLPPSDVVFPWLHGIRESNVTQRIYFSEKRREHSRKYYSSNVQDQPKISFTKDDLIDVPKTPDLNGLVIVKVYEEEPDIVDCDFTLRNSISPHEILEHKPQDNHNHTKPYAKKRNTSLSLDPNDFLPQFKDVDPRSGYSIRNLHIQIAKWATLSDVVLYSVGTPKGNSKLLQFASLISNAQKAHYRRSLANPGLSRSQTCQLQLGKKNICGQCNV